MARNREERRHPGEVETSATNERLLTTAELAQFPAVPIGTIHQWHHRGTGPVAYRVRPPRLLRYRRGEVLGGWLQDQAR